MATGTHGSGDRTGSLVSLFTRFEDGVDQVWLKRRVTEAPPDDLFGTVTAPAGRAHAPGWVSGGRDTDQLWLSGAHRRDTVALHFTWLRDEVAVRSIVREIEAALVPLGARPHWGKVFEMDAVALREAFPRLRDVAALRERVDPDRVFGNAFLDRVLGT